MMSLFFLKKVLLSMATVLLLFGFWSIYAWPTGCTILRDTKTGTLIGLVADYHAENGQEEAEARNIALSKKPLQKILNQGNTACLLEQNKENADFIKEKLKNAKDSLEREKIISEMVSPRILIEQLQIGVDYNSSAIISADWRTSQMKKYLFFYEAGVRDTSKKFYEKILEKMEQDNLNDLLDDSKKLGWYKFFISFFKKSEREKMAERGLKKVENYYATYVDLLHEKAKTNSLTVEEVLMLLKNHIDKINEVEQYAPDLAQSLIKKLDNFSTEIVLKSKKITMKKDDSIFLYDMSESDKYNDFTVLLNAQRLGERRLYQVLRDDLANFGFIVEIEKARKAFPLILLYAGKNHIEYIQKYYVDQGNYEIIFEIKNKNKELPKEKDLLEFFSIIQKESDKISQKKEKNLGKKTDKKECILC